MHALAQGGCVAQGLYCAGMKCLPPRYALIGTRFTTCTFLEGKHTWTVNTFCLYCTCHEMVNFYQIFMSRVENFYGELTHHLLQIGKTSNLS
jgi:hypothetical protein